MCRYPIVLAAPHESFRLHYAPSTHHFLKTRSTREEQRALTYATEGDPFVLNMGVEDDAFLGEGWWMAEGQGRDAARWAVGRKASVIVPQTSPVNRIITIEMQPLTHPTLPPQSVRVSLNGSLVAERALDLPAGEYAFAAGRALWREGVNVIDLDFSRSNVPAELSGSSDRRSLSAIVQTIRVTDEGSRAVESSLPPASTIRLAADLRQFPTGYVAPRRLDPSTLNHEAMSHLVARLGFDPVTTIPRLDKGALTLEELVMSIVWTGTCEDDMTFARRAFAILLQQVPNAGEEESLRAMLRRRSRTQMIEHLMQKNEFLNKLR